MSVGVGGHLVAGRQAGANASGYNATEFSVNGFTEALGRETADDGVRTTVIEPKDTVRAD